jgi:hypothetical protein
MAVMSDQNSHRQRTWRNIISAQPAETRDPMSPEHRQIEADVAVMQAVAARDPYLNGNDCRRRQRT